MKALIISADNFEDSELLVPYYRLREAGATVDIASLKKGAITGKHGYAIEANRALQEIKAGEYDLLVLPGGKAPEAVRAAKAALDIVKAFFLDNKPVAAICHGPQILISAGVMRGRRATCYKTVAGELRKAGAAYEDREVVVDGNLITSRQPPDLPAFMRLVVAAVLRKP
ncbi:MAG: type 1 glutamine amidotransferase [Gammaproteobacteria bacterium]|nr:type 1 glutamine amidotransferase [Gammaproteobacteria bacterium]